MGMNKFETVSGLAALTSSDAAAATASNPTAPAALTAANPTAPAGFTVPLVAQAVTVVSEAATDLDTVAAALKVLHTETTAYEVEISALVADAVAARAEAITYEVAISANIVDIAALVVEYDLLRADVTAMRTALNKANLV